MLWGMGFGVKWNKWVKCCIFTTSYAMMINGGPSSFFQGFKGFHQEDPLSPLPFIVVMEGLNKIILKAWDIDLFKGLSVVMGERR